MNDKPTTSPCDCSSWKISLPPRNADFAGTCACAERCDCRRRHRVRTTCAMLAVFVVAGAVFGFTGARRENDKNLATLREVHLQSLETGGDR